MTVITHSSMRSQVKPDAASVAEMSEPGHLPMRSTRRSAVVMRAINSAQVVRLIWGTGLTCPTYAELFSNLAAYHENKMYSNYILRGLDINA